MRRSETDVSGKPLRYPKKNVDLTPCLFWSWTCLAGSFVELVEWSCFF
jgi:hypothetical protein